MTPAIRGDADLDHVTSQRELEHVVREYAGRLATALVRVTGDFATAEDLVQDAVLVTSLAPRRPAHLNRAGCFVVYTDQDAI